MCRKAREVFRYTKRQSVSSICLSVVSSKSSSKSRREIIENKKRGLHIQNEDETRVSKFAFPLSFGHSISISSLAFLDPIPSKRRRLKAVVSIVRKNASHPVVASSPRYVFFFLLLLREKKSSFSVFRGFETAVVDWSSSFESAVIRLDLLEIGTRERHLFSRELESRVFRKRDHRKNQDDGGRDDDDDRGQRAMDDDDQAF